MNKKMTHVEDEIASQEIDDIEYLALESKTVVDDPFAKVAYSTLSPKMKRRAVKLSKKFEGEDGTSTKYIDPETLDGYSLYDIVNPPYDLDTLAGLFDSSSIHNASVMARVMNTVGVGYEFEETTKAKRKIEKAMGDPEKVSRVRKILQDEKARLDEIFENGNI